MASEQEITNFLQSTFRSVWSLETILLIASDSERCWSSGELVSRLRASELVVSQALEELLAAGLIAPEPENCMRYAPASRDLEEMLSATKALYARSPTLVRRTIIHAREGSLTAFSDAFRFRRGDQ